jgi:hypothetical protein
MSVTAGIEIATGGRPEPGQIAVRTKASGTTQSAEWANATEASSSSSSVLGAESFRSSWQSVLASLDAGLDGRSEAGTGDVGIFTSIESAFAGAGRTPSSATSTLLSGAGLPWRPGRDAATMAPTDSRAGGSALRVAPGAGQHTAATQAAKSPANVKSAESESRAHPHNSEKSVKPEAVSSGTATPLVSRTEGSNPLTDLSAGLLTGSTKDTAHPHPSQTDGPGSTAERANGRGNQAVDSAGTATQRGILSSAPDTAGPSAQTDGAIDKAEPSPSGRAESGTSADEGSSTGPIRSQAEEPIQEPAHSQAPFQAQVGSPGLEAAGASISGEGTDPSAATVAASQSAPPAAPSIGGRPDLGRSMRTSGPSAVRSGSSETDQHGNRPKAGQPAATALGAFGMTGDSASARMPVNVAGDAIARSSGAPAVPADRETFAALDAESAPGAPAWIHAGAREAEAGFQDPALGWIGVRADRSGAGIHAALVPGSADAAEALGGHMAGLNSYLAEQRTPVETLTLTAPEHHSEAPAMDQSGSQGMHQGTGQHTGQGASSDPQSRAQSSTQGIAAAVAPQLSAAGVPETTGLTARPGGVHISVMA